MMGCALYCGEWPIFRPSLDTGFCFIQTRCDRWTVVTVDHALSTPFEQTVLVAATGYAILTDRGKVQEKT